MGFIPKLAKFLASRLLLAWLVMLVCRIVFLICNWGYFSTIAPGAIFNAFLIGLRFDISATFIFLSPVFILSFIPFFHRHKAGKGILNGLYITILLAMVFVDFIDAGYFQYSYSRSTFGVLKFAFLSDDVTHFGPQLLVDFWYLFVCHAVLIYVVWKGLKYTEINPVPSTTGWKPYLALFSTFILFVGLFIIGVRGGLQYRPLFLMDAGAQRTAPLSLNTAYNVMSTFTNEELSDPNYLPTAQAQTYFSALKKPGPLQKTPQKLNVVLIVVESLSKEFVGYLNPPQTYTPFLDSLCGESLVFTRAFSNGRRSIEGIPAIISSLPTMLDKAVIVSNYNGNRFTSLANTLGNNGYSSAFFHGARNGSMAFESYSNKVGFQNYYGLNEYPNNDDYDGSWGIFDEPYLQYCSGQMSQMQQPFLSTVFTLSSHHPFALPKKYANVFPEGSLPIHKTVRYADYALRHFFEQAKKTSWFQNTLFIITADHATNSNNPYFQNRVGALSIPLIYYCPALKLKGINNTVTQQADIMPSVLTLLGYNKPFVAFGQSVFDTTTAHCAIAKYDQFYQIIEDNYLLEFDGTQTVAFYDLAKDSLLTTDIKSNTNTIQTRLEMRLKAYIQDYNQRLIKNTTEWNTSPATLTN